MSYDLNHVNRERRRRGLPPLSPSQASSAAAYRSSTSSNDMTMWLIMYAAMSPAYTTPAECSSSSYDSGSSSSYDSGSSY